MTSYSPCYARQDPIAATRVPCFERKIDNMAANSALLKQVHVTLAREGIVRFSSQTGALMHQTIRGSGLRVPDER